MTATTVFLFLFSHFLNALFTFRLLLVFLFILFLSAFCKSVSLFSFFLAPFHVFRHGHSMQFHYLHLAASGYARHRIVSIWVGIA